MAPVSRVTISAVGLLTVLLLSGLLQMGSASSGPSSTNSIRAFSNLLDSSGNVSVNPWQYPITPSNIPKTLGCFKYQAAQSSWIQEQCLPSSVTSKIPRPTEGGSVALIGELSDRTMNYGYVDVQPYAPYGESDSLQGSGAYSVQANTNGFVSASSGDAYWVQFTLQNNPKSGYDYLCIWTIDTTTHNYNLYGGPDCKDLPLIPLQGTSAGMNNGYMNGWAAGGLLGVQFCENGRSDCWYINEPDSVDLENHWVALTGTILGYGGRSEVTFIKSSTSVAQPYVDVETGVYKPKGPYLYTQTNPSTAESNNLFYNLKTSPSCTSDWCSSWEDSS